MTGPALDLPYFDMLLDGRRRGDPAARAFEKFVHWGYWAEPRLATRSVPEFVAAMERLDDEVLAAGELRDGHAVLDAGCGFGGTLATLASRLPKASLTGINIDGRQLVHARAAAPTARFVEGDACALPFDDASFDRVLAVECIFHFPSRARFLKEAARVLKPGGRVALSDFVPAVARASGGWLGRKLEAEIAKGYGAVGDGWRDGDYAAMAKAAGLKVVLDRDVTANTVPTYPVLLDLLSAPGAPAEAARKMRFPTRLLEWVSRLGFVRYRIVAFEK